MRYKGGGNMKGGGKFSPPLQIPKLTLPPAHTALPTPPDFTGENFATFFSFPTKVLPPEIIPPPLLMLSPSWGAVPRPVVQVAQHTLCTSHSRTVQLHPSHFEHCAIRTPRVLCAVHATRTAPRRQSVSSALVSGVLHAVRGRRYGL